MPARCRDFQAPMPGCSPCDFAGGFLGDFFAGPDTPVVVAPLVQFDFRSVTIQRKPNIAEVVALGVPAPSRFYDLTEAAVPFSDGANGAQNFTVLTNPTRIILQRSMLGLSDDGETFEAYTGVEFRGANYATAATAALNVGNNVFMDVGAAGSGDVVAVGILARGSNLGLVTEHVGKRDPAGTNVGWSLGNVAGGGLRLVADQGASIVSLATANAYTMGGWYFAIGRVRRQGGANDVVEIITVYEVVSASISALGTLTNASPFHLGAGASSTFPSGQVAAVWTWEGANAAALTQAHAQLMFTHAMDPTGLLTTYTRAGMACDQIGYEAGYGYLLGCYSGFSGSDRTAQVDTGYHAGFAHASKLGLRASIAVTNLCTHSDDFSDAAWAKVSTTIGVSGTADLIDGPDKMRNAQKITATAANGRVEDAVVTVASTEYTMSILLKSGTGANVPCRLIQQNITAGAENAGVDIVVTTEWQRFDLTATTAVGQIASGFRLRINTNGDIIHGKLAQFALGRRGLMVGTAGASVTMPATDIRAVSAAGEWLKSNRGELDVYAVTNIDVETYIRRLLILRTGATDVNGRNLTISVARQSQSNIFTSAAASTGVITSGAFDHAVPFVDRLLWSTPSPPVALPDILILLRSNLLSFNGTNVAWANSDTVDTWHFGQSGGAVNQLNGLIALVDSWAQPRTSFPAWP